MDERPAADHDPDVADELGAGLAEAAGEPQLGARLGEGL
jgi:hypothetical protein